ncbi:MAG: hypothetical protein K8R88_02995 [Armatimonadetes bacterium]|nr:hypothetical protein [Armatimonadota bacterium]
MKSTFSMTMDSGGGEVRFVARGIYDRFGRPKTETFFRSSPKLLKTMKVQYFRHYLVCDTVKNGAKSSVKINYPKKCDLTSPSLYWFITIKPKPATTEVRQQFDSDLMKIITRKVTYVKPETIVLNNKPLQGFRIDNKDGVFWMDKAGMPLEMDLGEVKLLRR